MGCPHDQVAEERLLLWQARVLAFLTYTCTPRRQGMTDQAPTPDEARTNCERCQLAFIHLRIEVTLMEISIMG